MAAFRCPSCNGWLKFPNVYQYKNNAKTKCVKCSADLYIIGDRRKKLSLTASYQNPNSIVKRIIALGKQFVRFLAKLFGLSAEELLENLENIEKAVNEFKNYLSYDDYFTGSAYEKWYEKYIKYHQYVHTWSINRFGIMKQKLRKLPGLEEILEDFDEFITNGQQIKDDYNNAYIEKGLIEHKQFFDEFGKNPLTDEQRSAVITDESNNFINAGAGCGKTETIIAKIAYLVSKKNVLPGRILALAFNKSAEEELKKRLSNKGIEGVDVHTFHSFGFQIIKEMEPKAPNILFTEHKYAKNEFFQNEFKRLLSHEYSFQNNLIHYFAYYLNEIERDDEFSDLNEYAEHQFAGGLQTLDGNYVKSKQEVAIGNFLYLHNIDYEYEKDYKIKTASKYHRQYQPDFYLTKYDIWLEHFAISKDDNGNETSIFGQRYMQDYKWKIKTHKTNGTNLLSTFSYQFYNNTIIQELKEMLENNSVVLKMRSQEAIIKDLKTNYKVPLYKFTELISTFISLSKSAGINPETLLSEQIKSSNNRNKLFLEILLPIYKAYQKELKDKKGIDFDDMISNAVKHLKNNDWQVKYKYLVIDEFQDIGIGRFNLIKEVKKQNPLARTFCVGDDWQAIYRFAGGDVSILFNFEKYFGEHSKRLYLTNTFRFSKELANLSNQFIQKNPLQEKKQITSNKDYKHLQYKLILKKDINDLSHHTKILEIANNFGIRYSRTTEVLVLNRYKFKSIEARNNQLRRVAKKYDNINLKCKTIHSQKGVEADFVIIDDVIDGFTGFPNRMGEDSVLRMLLEMNEDFQDAEERRLFYVALTRSKILTYILSINSKESTFYNEIDNRPKKPCTCGGFMVRKINNKTQNEFWGCKNYPICTQAEKIPKKEVPKESESDLLKEHKEKYGYPYWDE